MRSVARTQYCRSIASVVHKGKRNEHSTLIIPVAASAGAAFKPTLDGMLIQRVMVFPAISEHGSEVNISRQAVWVGDRREQMHGVHRCIKHDQNL